jgi:hypothetical protein
MTSAAVNRLVEAYKRQAEINGRELLRQHADWKNRNQFFPSTTPGDRGATSPLGGQATSKPETQKAPNPGPRKADWW